MTLNHKQWHPCSLVSKPSPLLLRFPPPWPSSLSITQCPTLPISGWSNSWPTPFHLEIVLWRKQWTYARGLFRISSTWAIKPSENNVFWDRAINYLVGPYNLKARNHREKENTAERKIQPMSQNHICKTKQNKKMLPERTSQAMWPLLPCEEEKFSKWNQSEGQTQEEPPDLDLGLGGTG